MYFSTDDSKNSWNYDFICNICFYCKKASQVSNFFVWFPKRKHHKETPQSVCNKHDNRSTQVYQSYHIEQTAWFSRLAFIVRLNNLWYICLRWRRVPPFFLSVSRNTLLFFPQGQFCTRKRKKEEEEKKTFNYVQKHHWMFGNCRIGEMWSSCLRK